AWRPSFRKLHAGLAAPGGSRAPASRRMRSASGQGLRARPVYLPRQYRHVADFPELTMTYQKPLPAITPLDKPYWEYARRHELRLQCCSACGKFRYPASPVCADCDSDAYEWKKVSGR